MLACLRAEVSLSLVPTTFGSRVCVDVCVCVCVYVFADTARSKRRQGTRNPCQDLATVTVLVRTLHRKSSTRVHIHMRGIMHAHVLQHVCVERGGERKR
jgi:hypothetical protein